MNVTNKNNKDKIKRTYISLATLGNSNVGKSCISIRATKNVFESEHIATVGFELFCYNVSIKEKILKLEIWDTCGSENYRSITTNYYRNSSLAIIVYSIDE